MTSAQSSESLAHVDDEAGAANVRLALAIEQQQPGYIDAYFGPAEWKAWSEAKGKRPPADLSAQALSLSHSIAGLAVDSQRRRFLAKQAAAMQTTLRILAGERVPYLDEVQQLYAVSPARVEDAVLEEACRTLETLLPSGGTLNQRLRERRKRFQIGREAAAELFEIACAETRRRTRSYTFTYSMGHALLEGICRRHEPTVVFRRLLSEPLTPDDLAAWHGDVAA